jgi:tripartite-type tricarboxylate transporter receptor subunit TctC
MNPNRRTVISTIVSAAGLAYAGSVWAAYPEKAVRLVVPYPAGGATDIIGRLLGQRLSVVFKQPFVVENRPGVSGNIGAREVAKSGADGHTLLMGALSSHAAMATLTGARAGYDLLKDFTSIQVVGEVPMVFVVHPSFPIKTFAELVTYARANPGKVSYASGGAGAPHRMTTELFRIQAGLEMLHIPYKGSAPAIADLVGGQVNMMADTVPSALPFIKAGKLRALAVTSSKRVETLPEVPTVAEAGGAPWKDFEVSIYYGLLAPTGTPAEALHKLNSEVGKVMRDPEVHKNLQQHGVNILPPQTLSMANQRLSREVARWTRVINTAGIKPDD